MQHHASVYPTTTDKPDNKCMYRVSNRVIDYSYVKLGTYNGPDETYINELARNVNNSGIQIPKTTIASIINKLGRDCDVMCNCRERTKDGKHPGRVVGRWSDDNDMDDALSSMNGFHIANQPNNAHTENATLIEATGAITQTPILIFDKTTAGNQTTIVYLCVDALSFIQRSNEPNFDIMNVTRDIINASIHKHTQLPDKILICKAYTDDTCNEYSSLHDVLVTTPRLGSMYDNTQYTPINILLTIGFFRYPEKYINRHTNVPLRVQNHTTNWDSIETLMCIGNPKVLNNYIHI